jgi:hypothetical protein
MMTTENLGVSLFPRRKNPSLAQIQTRSLELHHFLKAPFGNKPEGTQVQLGNDLWKSYTYEMNGRAGTLHEKIVNMNGVEKRKRNKDDKENSQ